MGKDGVEHAEINMDVSLGYAQLCLETRKSDKAVRWKRAANGLEQPVISLTKEQRL